MQNARYSFVTYVLLLFCIHVLYFATHATAVSANKQFSSLRRATL